jgi:hypothetical protein
MRIGLAVLAAALLSASAAGVAPQTPAPKAPPPQTPAPKTSAPSTPPSTSFDSGKAYEHLRQMVTIGPRPTGSAALGQTRAYITRQIASFGLTVQEQKFTADTPRGKVDMTNLIVRLPGRRTDRILLTGHYDTKIVPNQSFVGASDGASSAAILIELARVLKSRPHDFTYDLVWFDGEEAICFGWDECGTPASPDNTYGSRYYVQAARTSNALPSIKAMILFDMIGAKNLRIPRDGSSTSWLIDIIWAAAKRVGQSSVFLDTPSDVGGDDHFPFMQAGVPSADLIDLADYPQWHNQQCCDDLSHVAASSLQAVGDVILAALPDIERRLAR